MHPGTVQNILDSLHWYDVHNFICSLRISYESVTSYFATITGYFANPTRSKMLVKMDKA